MNSTDKPRSIKVLNTTLHLMDYESAGAYCEELARQDKASAVALSNTHLVATARHSPSFGAVLNGFDLVLPDGMPLIWTLNAKGGELKDRVYGPYFMQRMIQRTPGPWRHFFFGGTQECLRELSEAMIAMQPGIQIVGKLSPPYRAWTEDDECEFASKIRESKADFIWVALGGERQEKWIAKNLHRFDRGVFLAVGDAFELLAGRRPFAPDWMQRCGLTWAYRLLLEPRRLWKRYATYNSLFVWYLMRDALFTNGPSATLNASRGHGRGPKVVFVGSRGTPARYAGFETVVEQLGARLVERGFEVEVHNRRNLYPDRLPFWKGMRIRYLPAIPLRSLETLSHAIFSTLYLMWHRCDAVYLCGVGNGFLIKPLKWRRSRVIANVDGSDYKRPKWGGFARWWLHHSERWVIKNADRVIADNQTVVRHYQQEYGYNPVYLAYGATPAFPQINAQAQEAWLSSHGLKSGEYVLCVSRISRENDLDLLIRAYTRSGIRIPLVITGHTGYEKDHMEELKLLANENVIFTGGVYGDGYGVLSVHAKFFVLPAAIEATRLVLLDQMAFGKAILYRDCEATREVIAQGGEAFGGNGLDPVADGAEKMRLLDASPDKIIALGHAAKNEVLQRYDWETITDIYEEMICGLLESGRAEGRCAATR